MKDEIFDIDDRPLEERDPELAKKINAMTEEELDLSLREKGYIWNGNGFEYHPELDERKKQTNE